MKFKVLVVLALVFLFVGLAMAQTNVSGSWTLRWTTCDNCGLHSVNLSANGDTFTGTYMENGQSCPITEGEVNGDVVGFVVQCPNKLRIVFAGVIATDGISGGYIVDDGTYQNHGKFAMVRHPGKP